MFLSSSTSHQFLPAVLCAFAWLGGVSVAQAITLSPTTGPAVGQPGVTSLTLAGSNYPAGTILPSQVQISIAPVTAGAGSSVTFSPDAITTIVGTTRRLQFTIPSSIGVGSLTFYSVSVSGQTTSGVAFSSTNSSALTVSPPAKILSLSPSSGSPGQSLMVTIDGSFTNFTQGSTVGNFGPGISIGGAPSGGSGPVRVINQTTAVANLVIGPSAAVGLRDVTIQTGVQVATSAKGFSLTSNGLPNKPPVVSAGPPQAVTNSGRMVVGHDVNTLSSSVAGPNEIRFAVNLAHWLSGLNSGNILAVESLPGNATRDYAPDVKSALANAGFNVTYINDPAIVSAETSANLQRYDAVFVGDTYPIQTSIPSVALTQYLSHGGNVYMYGGVDDNAATEAGVLNPFLEIFGLAFDDLAYNGINSVDITSNHPIFSGLTGKSLGSGNGQDIHNLGTNPNASIVQFEGLHGVYAVVNASTSTIALAGFISDDGLPQGADLTASWSLISGPAPVPLSKPSTTFPDVAGQQNAATTNATFSAPGSYLLRLTGSDTILTSTSDVSITVTGLSKSPPVITSVMPNSGKQNQQNLSVKVMGQNTNFLQGVTTATFGTGIVVVSLSVNSPTQATAVLNVDPAAGIGARNVILTTTDEVAALVGGFTVTANNSPSLVSVSPVIGTPGQQNLAVSIVGRNSHFVEGTTTLDFGSSITIVSILVADSTHLSAVIAIDPGAAPGTRTVASVTNTESLSLPNGFTIGPPPPVITSIFPNEVLQAQSNLTVKIAGKNTHFTAASTPDFGSGVVIDGITVIDSSHLQARLHIDSTSGTGLRTLKVTSGNEVAHSQLLVEDNQASCSCLLAFDPTSGALLGTFASGGGLSEPQGLTYGPDGFLYVDSILTNSILKYDPETGAFIKTFANASGNVGNGIVFSPDGNLYASINDDAVVIYSGVDGSLLQTLPPPPGLDVWSFNWGMTRGPDDRLYLTHNVNGSGWPSSQVERYDGLTGSYIDTFVPFGSGGGVGLTNTAFGPDGNFYVADFSAGTTTNPAPVPAVVRKYNGQTGASMGPFILPGSGGIITAWGIAFDNENNLFLTGAGNDGHNRLIQRFDATTGQYLNSFGNGTSDAGFLSFLQPSLRVSSPTGPLPRITSVSPQSANPNQQGVSVSIVGSNSHFIEGTSTIDFGPGVTVTSLTIHTANSATAIINVASAAILSTRDVIVRTDDEIAVGIGIFSIVEGPPSITTISPNYGPQGLSGPISITAQNTHFQQGVTALDFGPGITVSNVSVGCPTCLTATLSISPSAAPGLRSFTVTTGTEVVTLVNGFNVVTNNTSPILTFINPAGAPQGQSLSVAITGLNTHWAQSSTTASFGAGITTTSVSVASATSLTANIVISPTAALGLRTVTVNTGHEIAAVANVFNVLAGATPIVYSLTPGSGYQGQQNLSISITGQNTHWVQGTTTASFGLGVTVSALTISSTTSATAVIKIDSTASVGARTVTLITGTESATFVNGFTVSAPGAIITGLNPGGTSQGAHNQAVTITGQYTHWAQGTTTASFGSGITIVSLTISSSTTATAVITVDPAASLGPRTVTLTTGTESAAFTNGFSIVAGVVGITEINPDNGPQGGQSLSLAVKAQYTHWVQGTTQATFGSGVTVVSLTITSATTATVVLNVDFGASIGTRDVTFKTGSETETAAGGFNVVAGVPTLASISPNSGQEGKSNLAVTLTGSLTHFVQGTTQAFFGADIIVNSVTVNSPTSVTALISIATTAALGERKVALQTGSEVISLNNGFTVKVPAPTLVSVSPSNGQQGRQNLSVTVSGQYTHFGSGSTASFGAGVTVVSLTASSANTATAVLDINAAAATGLRTVMITSGSEIVTLANGFTIQSGVSSALSVSPNSGMQSKTLSVTITGQSSHFSQGTTRARFGPGVMVGGGIAGDFGPVTVLNSTTSTAQLTILGTAMPAPRTVTLQTGSETISGANAFSVVGLPYLNSAHPSSAARGQTVDVTVNGSFTNFMSGTTKVSFGPGISVGGSPSGSFGAAIVNTSTSLVAHLITDANATLGPRTITVQTGPELVSTPLNFSVLGPVTGAGPQVAITSPTEASDVTAPTTVTGTVTSPNLDYWTLDYQGSSASTFTTIATGSTATVTGTFDPTLLLNGNAVIRLTATDTSGQTNAVSVTVVVTRNLKIGNFTIAFNDLSVPVGGLPIQVNRTYDSRYKALGDFGYGWRLDVSAAQITENIPLSDQWYGASSGGLFPTYCLQEVKPHKLTVTLNDGTTYEFLPVLSSNGCAQFQPPSLFNITFMPTGDTPPSASLSIAGSNQAVDGDQSWPGNITLLESDLVTFFDPDQYNLTLPNGSVLQLSRQFGLQKMTDLNGNSLTISPSGIVSSTGKSVTFQRDSQNRIESVTDPMGHVLSYSYDTNKDLANFTDASSNTSTYTYDSNHDLLTIQDPRHVQPIRNDYDSTGRLVSHTDAYGNVINYTNDPNTNQETVTDRLGNLTVNVYDADGNIVKVTDALGGVTKRTYDASGNVLTETNPLGNTTTSTYDQNNNKLTQTDSLGGTTTYTYNSRNEVLSLTDANHHVTTNAYDANGNLVSTTDANGNKTSHVYNAAGQQTSVTDPLRNVTSYFYDGSERLVKQVDALGFATTFGYDDNGNKTSDTRMRTTSSGQETLTTNYQYDASNRVTQTTYPDGSTTQTQYNNIGKQAVTIDQLNRQTSYDYDLMGRLTKTTYPDGTSETATYDAEGDRISSSDRAQRVTTYAYDALKRLVQTTYPDQSSTQSANDASGEVTSVTNGLGNVTRYLYDTAGRRTKVTDALLHATVFAYDLVGNQKSMTDANQNQTRYAYDALNRRTDVIYPDGTKDVTAYDGLGRIASKTDQAGVVTQYQYDALGRLTGVTDALNQITRYTFDEVGDQVSQTDANNHTTSFAYDKLGRRTQHSLPAGQMETMIYDAAGNLINKTDFNGKITTYTYDSTNRLTAKIPDASFSEPTVRFDYTATGQRQSMSDVSGTTSYYYDLGDRLIKKVTPEGTLIYTYDLAGNLTSIRSSNANGTSVNYSYDVDNRLSTVTDNRLASGTTRYSYDNSGNLQSYLFPNGVETTFSYNALNHLTNIGLASNTDTLASYAYQLGPTGNRTSVAEFGGRQLTYSYDSLYRLKSETIANDPIAVNGVIGYSYDHVGNRLQRTSTVGPVSASAYGYEADDRLTSDTYNASGDTIGSGGTTYSYDFENRLNTQNSGQVSITYDGDGNRVAEAANGVVKQYLLDNNNLTGYSQVLEELADNVPERVYTYGLTRISQSQGSGTSFFGYDGQGSVRILMDAAGAITDRYNYDAFGNTIGQVGTTANEFRFAGEQSDTALGLYNLRARYYHSSKGRFLTTDPFDGTLGNPQSLHPYSYASSNPINNSDPSGRVTLTEEAAAVAIIGYLPTVYISYAWSSRVASADAQISGYSLSLRYDYSAGFASAGGGVDISYDTATHRACGSLVGETGLSLPRATGRISSVSVGAYTGGNACDQGAPWYEHFGSSVSIPFTIGSVFARTLAPTYPFRGLLQRLTNFSDANRATVSIGIAGTAGASIAVGCCSGSVGIAGTNSSSPVSLSAIYLALQSQLGSVFAPALQNSISSAVSRLQGLGTTTNALENNPAGFLKPFSYFPGQ